MDRRRSQTAATGLCTRNVSRALIERPYSREPQAVGAVYDRPGFFVQSRELCEEGNPAALTFPRRSAGYPRQGIPDCPNWDIWLLFPRSTSSLPDRQIYPASAVLEYGSA